MTTTTLPTRRPEVVAIGWSRLLGRTLGAEWIKLRSVRSTYGSLAAAVAVTVGIAALAGWATITDDQPNPATATQLAAAGASVGQFGLVALAALAITGEFATGSIRTTLAATPARSAVLTAKAAVVGAVTFPIGLVATALATLAASAILGIGTRASSPPAPGRQLPWRSPACWWWAWARSCAAPPAPSPRPLRSCSPRRSGRLALLSGGDC